MNWEKGKSADIHYKVCDGGIYKLIDTEGNTILEKDGYVPGILSPGGSGYGDYIIMSVDENGGIDNWQFDIEDFIEEE